MQQRGSRSHCKHRKEGVAVVGDGIGNEGREAEMASQVKLGKYYLRATRRDKSDCRDFGNLDLSPRMA